MARPGRARLDRRVPLAVLGLELAAFGVALAGPAFSASPPPGLAGQAGSVQVAFLVARLRERCSAELASGAQIPADSGALEAELRRALPRTSFRDRWLAQLPPRVVVLAGREGPVLRPLPDDGPGTIYLAIAGGGTFGVGERGRAFGRAADPGDPEERRPPRDLVV